MGPNLKEKREGCHERGVCYGLFFGFFSVTFFFFGKELRFPINFGIGEQRNSGVPSAEWRRRSFCWGRRHSAEGAPLTRTCNYNQIILDLMLLGLSRTEALRLVRRQNEHAPARVYGQRCNHR